MVEEINTKSDLKRLKVLHTPDLNFVSEKIENYLHKLINNIENSLKRDLEDLQKDLRQYELNKQEFGEFMQSNVSNGDIKSTLKSTQDNKVQRKRTLGDKIFVARESYYTSLRGVNHINTLFIIIYHLLIMFFLNDFIYNYFIHGKIRLGFGTFKAGLVRIHYVFGVWLIQHILVFGLYYAFKCWASVYAKLQRQHSLQRFWSHSCLIVHISTQILFFYVPTALVSRFQLPFISAAILLLESCRLLMKMHAFVRTNAAKVLNAKTKTDSDTPQAVVLPQFSHYVYFLFAPTIIYRDHYPRTTHIRWGFALRCLAEVAVVAFFYAFLYERYIQPYFGDMGKTPITYGELLVKLSGLVFPSISIFVVGNYMLLHAWMNFGAELTRFGDRLFYKDWWNANNYDEFYRNWNIVVYDWLYEYVYKETYNHIFKGSKLLSAFMVFYISAVMHELLLGYALQVFFPVMLAFFGGLGVAFIFLTRRYKHFDNVFVWSTLIVGNAIMIFLYSLEYHARWNCPKTYENWYDYFIPAAMNCKYVMSF